MNIQIRVIAGQAQKQLAAVQAQTRAVGMAGRGAASGVGMLNGALNPARMIKFGSQTQWTGRQLTRNFTLPLLAAGAAGVKFALDNEAAFKRIVKVYGDGSQSAQQITNETKALGKAFEALSNEFGVNQSEVLKVAGNWAAAGASGLALARSTKLTLQTMVLGEIDAAKATEALIAIQAQYGQQVGELGAKHQGAAGQVNTLAETIGVLNMVENQTGISMAGLIEGMSKAAGVARSAGVPIQELASMMAALVPAAGSAANAGNALKTMLSRMMSPTQEAGQVLKEMGMRLDEQSWKSKTGAQRLMLVAKEYERLGKNAKKTSAVLDENGKATGEFISAQQAVASSVIASRWQINRFDVLMRSLTDTNGYYNKALRTSDSATKNTAQAIKELNIVLESSPHRLKQMGVILQNSLADIMQPMIPVIIILASYVAKLARAFSGMNPYLQKFIIIGLALLAVMGPLLIFFGSLITATGEIAKMFKIFTSPLRLVVGGMFALATAPFKLIAFGFTGIGKAALYSGKMAVAMTVGLKQSIAFATYAGGVQGMVARKIAAAWALAKGAVVGQMLLMKKAVLTGIAQMFLATQRWAAMNVGTSFFTLMYKLDTIAIGALKGLWASFRAWAFALDTAAIAKAKALWAGARAWTFALDTAAIAKTKGLWVSFRAWAFALDTAAIAKSKATWAGFRAWAFALDTAAIAKTKAVWAGMRAWEFSLDMISIARLKAAWAGFRAWAFALDTAAIAKTKAIWIGARAWAFALDTAAIAKTAALWTAARAWLFALDTAAIAKTKALWVAFRAWSIALDTAAGIKIVAIWALVNARLRAMWLATMVFTAGGGLARAALSGVRGLAAILPMIAKLGRLIAAALTGPWGIAAVAIIGIMYAFRDQLKQLWTNIGEVFKGTAGMFRGPVGQIQQLWENLKSSILRVFNALPDGVANALLAVVRIVSTAAHKVYELFQYLNPFAHHSPSLVENVTGGMAAVSRMYAKTGDDAVAAAGTIGGAMAAIRRESEITAKSFNDMIATANEGASKLSDMAASVGTAGKYSDERKDVAKVAPQALPTFDSLVSQLGPLDDALNVTEKAMNAQQAVVNDWQVKLDAASSALDAQQVTLDGLRDHLDDLTTAYDEAQSKMNEFASAPITGMGAMSDAIFENSMAQKKLQLQIMKWEDVNGSLDDTKKKIDLLAGAIETGQADISELRQGGAGSDILGPMNAQVDAMIKQRDELEKAVQDSPVSDMQKELDKLGRTGQMLDLENSIQFDPLTRAVDQLANGMKELPFDEIIAGVTAQKAVMEQLKPKIDDATAAVDKQQIAVDAANKARDAAQASYDVEASRLDVLKQKYNDLADAISNVKSALGDISGAAAGQLEAARTKKENVSPGLQNFRDAAGGSFPDPGGKSKIGMEGPLDAQGQLDAINQFTADSASNLEDQFGKIDMLDPFKKAWKKVTDWWTLHITPFWEPIKTLYTQVVGSIDWSKPFDGLFKNDKVEGFADKFRVMWDKIKGFFSAAWNVIKSIIALFAPDIRRVIDEIVQAWGKITAKLGPEIQKWGELLKPFLTALRNFAAIVGTILLAIAKVFMSIIGHTIGPVFDVLIDTIQNALQIIRGVIEIFTGLFTGDFGMMADGIKDIFQGLFDGIWDIIKGAVKIVWGVIEGFVGGIIGFFKWLYDELVGHSIIPDMIALIILTFKGLAIIAKWIWDNVLKPIVKFFNDHKTEIGAVVTAIGTVIWAPFKALIAIGKWIWDNVLKPLIGLFKGLLTGDFGLALTSLGKLMWAPFKGLIDLAKWFWNNVLSPLITDIKNLWQNHLKSPLNTVLRGFASIWNNVGSAIAKGINVGIGAVNKLIDGLNWVGSHVPGLSFNIQTISKMVWTDWTPPQFAKGGVLPKNVGEGFATSGARAIVGEGGRHPEYVIPTDPKHRKNALKLYGDLGNAIGGWGPISIPHVDVGAVWDTTKDVAGAVGGALRKGAVIAAFAAPLKAFDAIMGKMPNKPDGIKPMINAAKNDIYNWAKGVDKQIPAVGDIGSKTISGSGYQALINYMSGTGVPSTVTSTLRPGDPGYHGQGRAADFSMGGHGDRGYGDPSLRKIFEAFLPVGQNLTELILAGAPFNIKNGAKVGGYAWGQPGEPGNHWNHVHAALASGGITYKGRPVHAMMGEGSDREVIAPLTPLWNRLDRIEERQTVSNRGSGGDTVNNFYGDLSFPNINSGDDAEAFVRNLEILAKK